MIKFVKTYTLQADMARLTSSTHASSNRIQAGRSPTTLDGFALSPRYQGDLLAPHSKYVPPGIDIQFRGPNSTLGFKDQVPLLAALKTLTARGLIVGGGERGRIIQLMTARRTRHFQQVESKRIASYQREG